MFSTHTEATHLMDIAINSAKHEARNFKLFMQILSSLEQSKVRRGNKRKQTVFSYTVRKKRYREMKELFYQFFYGTIIEVVHGSVQNVLPYQKRSSWQSEYHLKISLGRIHPLNQHFAVQEFTQNWTVRYRLQKPLMDLSSLSVNLYFAWDARLHSELARNPNLQQSWAGNCRDNNIKILNMFWKLDEIVF